MSVVSSNSLQFSHIRETTPGVTPTNPAFKLWRLTSESLVFAPQTAENTEIGGGGRFAKPASVTGMSVNGSINFNLATFDALKEAIAGVLAGEWGECPLTGATGGAIDSVNRVTVGEGLQTFTIEKRFSNPNAVKGTIQSVAAGAVGSNTIDLTMSGGPAVGTGMVVVDIQIGAAESQHVAVPIAVGDTDDAVATAVATAINALPGMTASATAAVVTVTGGAGGLVTTIDARTGNDAYFYQRFRGCSYSQITFSVAPNADVTGAATVVGGVPELDVLPLAGATYVSAGNSPVFNAPRVLALTIGNNMAIGTNCWTSLDITLNSNNRGIPCIGTQGDREVVLGTFNAEMSGNVYFSNQEILQALMDNDVLGDGTVTMSNADGDVVRFDWYGLKPTAGQLAAGGAGQDLVIPVTVQPTPVKVCDDGTSDWLSGLIISTVDTAPTLP